MKEHLNKEEEFRSFKIPDKFFNKLFEFTGSEEANKGYILVYVDQNGNPIVRTETSSAIIEMGLRKALMRFLKEAEDNEKSVDIGDVEE